MKLISHRGNILGPQPSIENSIPFIQAAIDKGYDVEVDVRLIDGLLYLGHDNPDYLVDLRWIIERKDWLWIHAKNFSALSFLLEPYFLRIFYHQLEKHTIIGNIPLIWSHDISEASHKSIIPLLSMDDINKHKGIAMEFYGVCSDYIEVFK